MWDTVTEELVADSKHHLILVSKPDDSIDGLLWGEEVVLSLIVRSRIEKAW